MKRNDASGHVERGRSLEKTHFDLAIPFLAGRPERDSNIGPDDLTNLAIALYTCKTFSEFLSVT